MPTDVDDELSLAFAALADPTRRQILAKLAEGDADGDLGGDGTPDRATDLEVRATERPAIGLLDVDDRRAPRQRRPRLDHRPDAHQQGRHNQPARGGRAPA